MSLKQDFGASEGRPRSRALSTRRGAAKSVVLLVLLGAALAAALVWWRVDSGENSPAAAQPSAAVEPAPPLVEIPSSERLDRPGAPPPGDRRYLPELFDPARFDGQARLEVLLDAPRDFRGPWTLALAPSKVVIGGDRARGRSLELAAGTSRTVLDDVALGGYEIRALAEGMECETQYIQFAKPDELDVVLRLRLFPAGDLVGRVLEPDGAPVRGLPLFARRKQPELERTSVTDAQGYYVFERLPDGEYKLSVGYRDAALLERELSFSAPGFTMPDLTTPRIAALHVRVMDAQNQPVADAKVSLVGLASGAREAMTDINGLARFEHCVEGDASVYVDAQGYTANPKQLHFQPGLVTEHQVRVRAP